MKTYVLCAILLAITIFMLGLHFGNKYSKELNDGVTITIELGAKPK